MNDPAAKTVKLFAAGSLKAALTDIGAAFAAAGGGLVEATCGPSGLLKNKIANGAAAHVFASANMEHPQTLHDAGIGGPVILFARNTLCALVRPELDVSGADLLERMLAPDVKLGTSTPKADPSGDYAFAMFKRADAIKPGARATLEKKALQLTGTDTSAVPPAGRNVYGWHVAEGRADIFLTYATNAMAAQRQYPGQKSVMLPDALTVAADYGLTVMKDAPAGAKAFAQFILSPTGQSILAGHGFAPAAR